MNKRWFFIPAFLTAWMFLFSALSTCYCAPVSLIAKDSAQSDMQAKMPAHCQHQSDTAKQKKSDCSPRVNSDQFEISQAQSHFNLKVQEEAFLAEETFSLTHLPSEKSSIFFILDSSPPLQLFLLHHSFLI